MNLREYAEQAVPLLQAVLEGKALEFRSRLGSANHVPQWEGLIDPGKVDHFDLSRYEVRVKVEAPDTVLVQIHGDGVAGGAWTSKEPQPNPELLPGQLVRYVREDLVVRPVPQDLSFGGRSYSDHIGTADMPKRQAEALAVDPPPVEDPPPQTAPPFTARVGTDWGNVAISGSEHAVVGAIEAIGRGRQQG